MLKWPGLMSGKTIYPINQHNTMINAFIYEAVTSNFKMIYGYQSGLVP